MLKLNKKEVNLSEIEVEIKGNTLTVLGYDEDLSEYEHVYLQFKFEAKGNKLVQIEKPKHYMKETKTIKKVKLIECEPIKAYFKEKKVK